MKAILAVLVGIMTTAISLAISAVTALVLALIVMLGVNHGLVPLGAPAFTYIQSLAIVGLVMAASMCLGRGK